MFSLSAIVGLSFAVGAYSFIGPNANVYVKNKYILPDGFNRSYVALASRSVKSKLMCFQSQEPFWQAELKPAFRFRDPSSQVSRYGLTALRFREVSNKFRGIHSA